MVYVDAFRYFRRFDTEILRLPETICINIGAAD